MVELTKSRIVGILLILVGLIMIVWFFLFAPYCARYVCGCTGVGEEYASVLPFGVIFVVMGVALVI